jgi:hypothetical protein
MPVRVNNLFSPPSKKSSGPGKELPKRRRSDMALVVKNKVEREPVMKPPIDRQMTPHNPRKLQKSEATAVVTLPAPVEEVEEEEQFTPLEDSVSNLSYTHEEDDDDLPISTVTIRNRKSEESDSEQESQEDRGFKKGGSLSLRMKSLRAHCVKNLGDSTFQKLYEYMKKKADTNDPNATDESTVEEEAKRNIGSEKLEEYLSLISQLIFIEENV